MAPRKSWKKSKKVMKSKEDLFHNEGGEYLLERIFVLLDCSALIACAQVCKSYLDLYISADSSTLHS
jgi:hypothetical protein